MFQKKFFALAMMLMLLIAMAMSTTVYAASTNDVMEGITGLPTDWVTWDIMSSFVGMAALVAALTQIIKMIPFPFNDKVDPKWYTLIFSILLNFALHFIHLKDYSVEGIVLMIINILVVFASAVGAYEAVIKPVQKAIQNKSGNNQQ